MELTKEEKNKIFQSDFSNNINHFSVLSIEGIDAELENSWNFLIKKFSNNNFSTSMRELAFLNLGFIKNEII